MFQTLRFPKSTSFLYSIGDIIVKQEKSKKPLHFNGNSDECQKVLTITDRKDKVK